MPAPMTSAVEPGVGDARFREWIATESGSRRAAASKETLSGILGEGVSAANYTRCFGKAKIYLWHQIDG